MKTLKKIQRLAGLEARAGKRNRIRTVDDILRPEICLINGPNEVCRRDVM